MAKAARGYGWGRQRGSRWGRRVGWVVDLACYKYAAMERRGCFADCGEQWGLCPSTKPSLWLDFPTQLVWKLYFAYGAVSNVIAILPWKAWPCRRQWRRLRPEYQFAGNGGRCLPRSGGERRTAPGFLRTGYGSAFHLDSEVAVFLEYHKVAGYGAGEEEEGPEAADGD